MRAPLHLLAVAFALAFAVPTSAAPSKNKRPAKAAPQPSKSKAGKTKARKTKASKSAKDDLALSTKQLEARIKKNVGSLGPMSVGHPNSGALFNGVQMPKSKRWVRMEPGLAWGTKETVDYLTTAINAVSAKHKKSHKMYIGHISGKRGGYLSPHKSHQSGRDVDISYFYKNVKAMKWYRRVNAKNLDRARTWTFVRALLTDTDVQYIFINTSVQKLLKQHARSIGEDARWLDDVFQYKGKKGSIPIIRHAPGHDTHIHVRFYNPTAQELGRRAYPLLVKHKKIKPRTRYIRHKARKGDILGRLASRYKTTVAAIKKINKIRGNKIFKGRVYLIPKKETKGNVRKVARMTVPPRRLPPSRGGTTRGRKAAPSQRK